MYISCDCGGYWNNCGCVVDITKNNEPSYFHRSKDEHKVRGSKENREFLSIVDMYTVANRVSRNGGYLSSCSRNNLIVLVV